MYSPGGWRLEAGGDRKTGLGGEGPSRRKSLWRVGRPGAGTVPPEQWEREHKLEVFKG